MYEGAHGGQGRYWVPRAGVIGDFDMPDVGASNQAQSSGRAAALLTEPSLQPWSKYHENYILTISIFKKHV